jgi:hypothetical protein
MPDYVLDASVVAFANGNLAARRRGNVFDRRLRVIEQVVAGNRRLRYNQKLLGEYQRLIRVFRNDAIELLFGVLDSQHSVLVARNSLSRQHHDTATKRCRWPSHDQHLLAAALGGVEPSIFVTEAHLANCAPRIFAHFAIRVCQLA